MVEQAECRLRVSSEPAELILTSPGVFVRKMVATPHPQGGPVPYTEWGGGAGRQERLIDISWQDVFAGHVWKPMSHTHLITYAFHQSKQEVMQESGVWLRASHNGNFHPAR